MLIFKEQKIKSIGKLSDEYLESLDEYEYIGTEFIDTEFERNDNYR